MRRFDYSSLTRIRQRWGAERFRKIFKRAVDARRRSPPPRSSTSMLRSNKAVVVGDNYPALLRPRRRRERWRAEDRRLYQRRRWRSEGIHGEAKSWHGLARAIRRSLASMKIQAYLTAAVVNLKRLAALYVFILASIQLRPSALTGRTHSGSKMFAM
jgi:Transposase DDE domain